MGRLKKLLPFNYQLHLKDSAIRLSNGRNIPFLILNNQKGFLLISIIFIMLLMAVSIFSINYYSTTQIRIASNHASSIQTSYDLNSIVEESLWELTDNPLLWRQNPVENIITFTRNGVDYDYTRIVSDAGPYDDPTDPLYSYRDAVAIQVTPKGASQSLQRSFRYYTQKLEINLDVPGKISMDTLGDLLIADSGHHEVLKRDLKALSTETIAGRTGKIAGDLSSSTSWFWFWSLPKLNNPAGVCTTLSDTNKIYYIAESDGHRISRVVWPDSNWGCLINRTAGDNYSGFEGDNGPATNARLHSPQDVFLYPVDNPQYLYIADMKNHCIRRVNISDNEISTIAGIGVQGDSADGVLATSARLNSPSGIFVDSTGNLYIADTGNNKIKIVDASSGEIRTVAGGGTNNDDGVLATDAQLNSPVDIFIDMKNNIFIAEQGNNKCRVVVDTNNKIYTLAGTGSAGDTIDEDIPEPAVEGQLNAPSSIVMASFYGGKRIYISDKNNNKIKVLLWRVVPGL